MSSEELKREFLLKPQNDAVWRIMKRAIVNEAIMATINVDASTKLSNSLVFGLYGIVRLRANGEEEHSKSLNNDWSSEMP